MLDSSTIFHQPRDIAVDLLGRLIKAIAIEKLEDVSGVFHLLAAHSRAVQRTAYTILHRYIPQAQEQVSFDVALSKSVVNLPDELVSLLFETPKLQMLSMSWGDDKMWTSMRSYLLSWKVVFDHFSNAVSSEPSRIPVLLIDPPRSRFPSRNTTQQTSRKTTF